jgi:hypothetical protein
MKKTGLVFVFLFFCIVLRTVNAYAGYGKSGWEIFERISESDYRYITKTVPSDSNPSSLFVNPALQGANTQRQLYFISECGIADDKLCGVLYGIPMGSGMLSLGAAYYDAGSVELNWFDNTTLMSQTVALQRDMMVIFSYGFRLANNDLLGLSLKLANEEIAQRASAQAWAVDAGFVHRLNSELSVSGALLNMGGSTAFINKANPLPFTASLALSRYDNFNAFYLKSCVLAEDNFVDEIIRPGLGFAIGCGPLNLNAEYFVDDRDSNLSLGLGVVIGDLEVGYSLAPGTNLGTMQKISMGIKFSSFNSSKPKYTRSHFIAY